MTAKVRPGRREVHGCANSAAARKRPIVRGCSPAPRRITDESLRTRGYTFDNTGTYDKAHLTEASVLATIPMLDGSTFDVDVHWAAESAAVKYGHSGPESEQTGFPARAVRDACTTANFLDHQKHRDAAASGTIGISLDSFGFHWAGIFDNWFHWTVTTHGNCTG